MTERNEIESLSPRNSPSSGRRQTYKQHRFAQDKKCTRLEACTECHGVREERAVMLSERVRECLTAVLTFERVMVQGMEVCLTEVTAQPWRLDEACCILGKARCSLVLECRYKVDWEAVGLETDLVR